MFVANRPHLKPTPHAVDAAEFEELVSAHEIFVCGRPGATRILPRFIVAQGMTCDGRRLMDADFSGADLSRTSFVETDLTRASFYGARLIRCDFRRATLHRADLRGAALAGAQLTGANLDEAEMRGAVLVARDPADCDDPIGSCADLQGSTLDGAQLDELIAEGVNFRNCSLRGAKLRNADLKNANLAGANLENADLEGAQLAGVRLEGAILTGVDLAPLCLSDDMLIDCVLGPSAQAYASAAEIREIITQTELWIETEGAQGVLGRLDDADLRVVGEAFKARALTGLSAQRALGVSVDFSQSQLQGATFDGADLRRANFQGADLRGASFAGAKLAHADFTGADVGALLLPSGRSLPTRFTGANLDGARLRQPTGA